MTYYETPGMLDDIACFMVDYYNADYIIKRFYIKLNETQNNFMEFSNELKSMVGSLPEELHPFAYSSDKTAAFITSMTLSLDFETVTFESFVEYMYSPKFINDFCHHWFNIDCDIKTIEDIENNKLTGHVNSLPHPEDIKYKLYMVLTRFEQSREEFIKKFIDLSGYVRLLRDKYRDLISNSRDIYTSHFFSRHVTEAYNIVISNSSFTVPLINSIICYYSTNREITILGVKYYLCAFQGFVTNLHTFSFIFNDPLRVQIVEFIHQNQPVTNMNICDHFSEKRSALSFHVHLLCEEGVLTKKQYADGKFYLTINQEYFSHIPKVFQQTFGPKNGVQEVEVQS